MPEPHFVEFADGFPPIAVTTCEPCMKIRRISNERARLSFWYDNTPPEFQKPWDKALGNNRLLERVLRWEHHTRRGLVISGESGQCKTRVCYQLMRRLTLNFVVWRVIRTASLVESHVPEGTKYVPVLVLDDLGNEITGRGIDIQLLNLISARCDANRPTIITSQHTPETFAQRYPGQASSAIIRRLGEFCDYINANDTGRPKHEQRGLGI